MALTSVPGEENVIYSNDNGSIQTSTPQTRDKENGIILVYAVLIYSGDIRNVELSLIQSIYKKSNSNNKKRHIFIENVSERIDSELIYTRVREESLQRHKTLKQCSHERPLTIYWTKKSGERVMDGYDYIMKQLFTELYGLQAGNRTFLKPTESANTFLCVANGGGDVSFNSYYPTTERYKSVDFTTPFTASPLCVMILKAPKIPFYLVLFLPYKNPTWGAIFISLLVASIAWSSVHYFGLHRVGNATRRSRGNSLAGELGRGVLDVAQIILSSCCSRLATTSVQRLVLASILLFSLVLSNAYSGQLLGFLTTPPRYADPQTLQDVDILIEHLYTHSDFLQMLSGPGTSSAMQRLGEKLVVEPFAQMLPRLKSVSQSSENAYLSAISTYDIFARYVNITSNGEIMLHLVPEYVFSPGYASFLVRKNLPQYDLINQFVLHVSQSGLVNHWRNAQLHHMNAHGLLVHDGTLVRYPESLTSTQLRGAFLVLGFGLGLSSVVFLVEKLGHHNCYSYTWFSLFHTKLF